MKFLRPTRRLENFVEVGWEWLLGLAKTPSVHSRGRGGIGARRPGGRVGPRAGWCGFAHDPGDVGVRVMRGRQHPVRSEGVAKPGGMGLRDLAALAIVTEQRAKAGWGQGQSTGTSLLEIPLECRLSRLVQAKARTPIAPYITAFFEQRDRVVRDVPGTASLRDPGAVALEEAGGLLQPLGRGRRRQFRTQMRDALPEWQVEEQLNQPDQVAAATAPRAVEQVLTDLDVNTKAVFPGVTDIPPRVLADGRRGEGSRCAAAGNPAADCWSRSRSSPMGLFPPHRRA
jgi:hypothetical protein